MNIFDKFIIGETTGINWCFENRHFQERLQDNGISRQYVIDCIMKEEPISWEHVEGNTYAVVFSAPPNKDYKGLEVRDHLIHHFLIRLKIRVIEQEIIMDLLDGHGKGIFGHSHELNDRHVFASFGH